jgi:hypothetical protein
MCHFGIWNLKKSKDLFQIADSIVPDVQDDLKNMYVTNTPVAPARDQLYPVSSSFHHNPFASHIMASTCTEAEVTRGYGGLATEFGCSNLQQCDKSM